MTGERWCSLSMDTWSSEQVEIHVDFHHPSALHISRTQHPAFLFPADIVQSMKIGER